MKDANLIKLSDRMTMILDDDNAALVLVNIDRGKAFTLTAGEAKAFQKAIEVSL